jgi:hypothetical protein
MITLVNTVIFITYSPSTYISVTSTCVNRAMSIVQHYMQKCFPVIDITASSKKILLTIFVSFTEGTEVYKQTSFLAGVESHVCILSLYHYVFCLYKYCHLYMSQFHHLLRLTSTPTASDTFENPSFLKCKIYGM